ncbi:MAG: hypothetical protein CMM61_11835 [Rhodospirillaceae bacterium]|nr:hypothetical protein [Rhodospirillaceae bacterium]
MKYVLLSNDYELFFGANHLPETDVLCAPTDKMLDRLAEAEAPMTFFCDVACLWRYRELGKNNFVDAVEEQLRAIVARGHDVQAHLHPHWLYTDFTFGEDGTSHYRTQGDNFSLSSSARDNGTTPRALADDLGRRAKSYLEEVIGAQDPDYTCLAYRAGGYCLQPDAAGILAGLRAAGYLVDSSVVPDMYLKSDLHAIDFRRLPREANYWMDDIGTASATENAGLFEVPIAAGAEGLGGIWPAAQATLRRAAERRSAPPLNGASSQTDVRPSLVERLAAKANLIRWRLLPGWDLLELNNGDVDRLMRITDSFIRRHNDEASLFFSLNSHSKIVNDDQLQALGEYVRRMRDTYRSDVAFVTFAQVPGLAGMTPL